jgi:hypothetical protein
MGQRVPLHRGTNICSWCTRWTRTARATTVGLYQLNPVDPYLESARSHPLNLEMQSPVSKFAFKWCQLVPLHDGDFLLNEKKFASWTDFLKRTSEDLFTGGSAPGGGGGRMTCDCWRAGLIPLFSHFNLHQSKHRSVDDKSHYGPSCNQSDTVPGVECNNPSGGTRPGVKAT